MVYNAPDFTSPPKDCSEIQIQVSSTSDALDAIRSMIHKYGYKWTERQVSSEVRSTATKERVLVTGTTGALGSYLLVALLENDSIETVWALNRKSKEGLMTRQKASFEDKMLDVSLLRSVKLVMLEGDVEDAMLRLREDMYQEVSTNTHGRKARRHS